MNKTDVSFDCGFEGFDLKTLERITYRIGVELSERRHVVGSYGGRDFRKEKCSLSVRSSHKNLGGGFRIF